jgi:hypothetical protein
MFKARIARQEIAAAVILSAAAFAFSSGVSAQTLRIENKRDVALSELKITHKDGEKAEAYILVRDIAGGKRVSAKVPPGKCLFDVEGVFEDKSQLNAQDMNLCAQHTLRLVE